MKFMIFFLLLSLSTQHAVAEYWNLPQVLSPKNSAVTFEVDSTWHLIKGSIRNFEGNLWLEDPGNFESVRGSIRFPVSEFDTDNESRDEKMRRIMQADKYPYVEFVITAFDASRCAPEKFVEAGSCQLSVMGNLTINNVTRNITVQASAERRGETIRCIGTTSIKWSEYDIEDPSILVAKLYEDVEININLILSKGK